MIKELHKNGLLVRELILSKGLTIFTWKANLRKGPKRSGLLGKELILLNDKITSI